MTTETPNDAPRAEREGADVRRLTHLIRMYGVCVGNVVAAKRRGDTAGAIQDEANAARHLADALALFAPAPARAETRTGAEARDAIRASVGQGETERTLREVVDFAYEHGLHEMGYDLVDAFREVVLADARALATPAAETRTGAGDVELGRVDDLPPVPTDHPHAMALGRIRDSYDTLAQATRESETFWQQPATARRRDISQLAVSFRALLATPAAEAGAGVGDADAPFSDADRDVLLAWADALDLSSLPKRYTETGARWHALKAWARAARTPAAEGR